VREFQVKFELAMQRRDDAQRQLEEENAELIKILTETGDFEYFRTELQKLTSHARELGLEQIGIAARREAIERRIDELREKTAKAAAEDPLLEELQKVVAARRVRMERLRANGTDEEQQGAEAEYAAARAQLIRAQREAGAQSHGAVIQELNNELSTLMIKTAELAEKKKAIETEISSLREMTVPRHVAEIEMLKARIELAQEQLAEAERRVSELQRNSPPALEQITLRPLEEALLDEGGEEKAD
jgi:chromosome segregation ATPase